MNAFRKAMGIFQRLEDGFLVILLLFLVTLSFFQILLRILFRSGWIWADPLLRYTVLWVGLLGAALATKEGRHLNIDMVTRFISERSKEILNAFTNLFSAFVCFFLFMASLSFVRDEYRVETMAFGGVPEWIIGVILPIAFFMITLRFASNFVKGILTVLGRSSP